MRGKVTTLRNVDLRKRKLCMNKWAKVHWRVVCEKALLSESAGPEKYQKKRLRWPQRKGEKVKSQNHLHNHEDGKL